MSESIYTVTAIHSPTDCRCFGWFGDSAMARQAVRENWADLSENGYYKNLVIEQIAGGIHPVVLQEWWFELGEGASDCNAIWREAARPAFAERTVNWALG